MLGQRQLPIISTPVPGRDRVFVLPKSPQKPIALTEKSLSEFLNAPRRTRLTDAHAAIWLAPFEIAARSQGELITSDWLEGVSPFRAIHELQIGLPAVDLLQLSLVTGRSQIAPANWSKTLNADRNGRFGLEVEFNGTKLRVSPFETIATNRPLEKWFEIFLEEKHLTAEKFFSLGGHLSLLDCEQFQLDCCKPAKAVKTYRGNRLVEDNQPTDNIVDDIVAGISRWFMANQDQDGALPYKYWPSSGVYSSADNPIRRFMASVAFNRMALALDRQEMKVAAKKNLNYNLRRFYKLEDGKGVISWNDSVKLGSLAMAGLAIIESPYSEKWADELAQLRQAIDCLWQPSGAFRTFLYPADRNDNQNFYPGEALLFWATSLKQQFEEKLADRAIKSFHYYRIHFRRSPNPAFVPWHSQAALILYELTGQQELRDFVFEMNDWLLPHQQWGGSLAPDHWGRFYTPEKSSYGPPHASATGVYLEGLVDALALAHKIGDEERALSYELAIKRGIRSLAQLQYRDSLDAFYVSHRSRVMGAIRTETDDNEIRIDNLQHGLMALLKYRARNHQNRFDATSKTTKQSTMETVIN
jgi:hypothetical protein